MTSRNGATGGTRVEVAHGISASVKKKRYSAGDEKWEITLYGPRSLIDEIHAETYDEGRKWSGGTESRFGDPENCYYHLGLIPPPAPYPRRKTSNKLRDSARIGLRGAPRGRWPLEKGRLGAGRRRRLRPRAFWAKNKLTDLGGYLTSNWTVCAVDPGG